MSVNTLIRKTLPILRENPFYEALHRLKTIYLLGDRLTRRNLVLLEVLKILQGFTGTAVTLIVTFVLVLLGSPAILQENKYLATIYNYFQDVTKQEEFIALFVVFALVAFILLMAFSVITSLILARFSILINHQYTTKALRNSLTLDYELTLSRSTDEMLHKVQGLVGGVVNQAVSHASQFISTAISSIVILSIIFYVNVYATLLLLSILLLLYMGLYRVSKHRLQFYGLTQYKLAREKIRTLRQGFSGYLEVFFMEKSDEYINNIKKIFQETLRLQLKMHLMQNIPGSFIRVVTIVILFSIAVYALVFSGGREDLTALIVFVGASSRVLPLFASYYGLISSVRHSTPQYEKVLEELQRDPQKLITYRSQEKPAFVIDHFEKVELNNVDYVYPGGTAATIKNLTLDIHVGESVVLCGRSGAGKTTIAKLCCGLFQPKHGEIRVNGHVLNTASTRRQWHRLIGYIPQKPFLADDTIAANIAFELDHSKIDFKKVESVLDQVNLLDFVRSLAAGINTQLSNTEIGVSGGQAQRFAIARALYRDSQLLVMDEATNALDFDSAKKVIHSIVAIKPRKALLVISHSIESVLIADKICVIDYGELITQGKYKDLINASELFRSLVKQYSAGEILAESENN